MATQNLAIKFIVVAALVALFFAAQFLSAQAQAQPYLWITWHAESYAPPGFGGKILPTAGSPITASFEVIGGGKPANVSAQTVYWYLNNELISNKAGTKTVKFNAPSRTSALLDLRIELPTYPGGLLLRTARIPVVSPEAVIEAPYPDKAFSGAQIKATGRPYFFNIQNISELNFSWSVDGQTPGSLERPQELIVNLDPSSPMGTAVNLALTILNAKNQAESGSGFLILRKQ
ncbi:MAG: hypothetical protein AAB897_03650 [Patescibacteria group bacterium]